MEKAITAIADPAELRAEMVSYLVSRGFMQTTEIIRAFSHTERHRFLPGADPVAAYADSSVPIKHDDLGKLISCISTPSGVAIQLEQLGVQPGDKVLEAGAATGYNASLLGRLAGAGGSVWTLDVDQDLVETAAANLRAAGVSNATALLADGAAGLPEHAPFDRIQFTVGAGDIPVQVLDQLAPGGRLVVPMRIRGSISRSFAFERDGAVWRTTSSRMCGFIPMRNGIGADERAVLAMSGDDVTLDLYGNRRRTPRSCAPSWTSLPAPSGRA